jgi:hypothetical protein
VKAIRLSVAAAAVTMFLAISAGILVQFATGNDPALAKGTSVSLVSSKHAAGSTSSASSQPSAVTTSAS